LVVIAVSDALCAFAVPASISRNGELQQEAFRVACDLLADRLQHLVIIRCSIFCAGSIGFMLRVHYSVFCA
jgi:hypothetical protein